MIKVFAAQKTFRHTHAYLVIDDDDDVMFAALIKRPEHQQQLVSFATVTHIRWVLILFFFR